MARHIRVGAGMTVGTGQPTEAELERLREAGFHAVVDLRSGEEAGQALPPGRERAIAEALGLGYAHVPVPEEGVLDEEALEHFRREICRLPAPVFVHCTSGKRAGSLAVALEAALADDTGAAALDRIDQLGFAYGPEALRGRLRGWVDRHSRHLPHRRPAPPRAPAWLPTTAGRVEAHSPERANRRIGREIRASLHHHAAQPDGIGRRLRELDREWDMERTLETNAAALALTGVLLGLLLDRRFLLLPLAVTGFLLQHALQGWCPPVPFFRNRGVRTAAEIEHERSALKALRGDFHGIPREGDAAGRAAAAFRAATA